MTNPATMAGLQRNVYPKYDELKDLMGIDGVKKHLSFLCNPAIVAGFVIS